VAEQKQANDLQALKKSLDLLILIELCKSGASYPQIREVMGTADNNTISKVKKAISNNKKEK
jgi:hypothetical protein